MCCQGKGKRGKGNGAICHNDTVLTAMFCTRNPFTLVPLHFYTGFHGVGRTAAGNLIPGGKSGLHRAECQVTPGRREPTESATENTPPKRVSAGKGEMVR